MNVYLSGSVIDIFAEQYAMENGMHRLVSFAYPKYLEQLLKWQGDYPLNLMLDSGAFTAWSKGDQVHLPSLIDCAKELQDRNNVNLVVINLDKIPGEKGRDPTADELHEAEGVSLENFQVMRDALGDCVLPVYHQGESEEVLQRLLRLQAPYICISPRNDVHERHRVRWCNEVFDLIPRDILVHGLATTGYDMMRTNPWYSVDSATYLMIASYGYIWFGSRWRMISISCESPNMYDEGRHYETLSAVEKKAIDHRMEEWALSYEELTTDFRARIRWNVRHIKQFPVTPNHRKVPTLFNL